MSDPADRASALVERLSDRLKRYRTRRIVISYDGSVQDKLLFELLHRNRGTFEGVRIEIVCGTRPCMDEALKAEVQAFARSGGFEIADVAGGCAVRPGSYAIESHRCGDIGRALARRQEEGGLHIVASITHSLHAAERRRAIARAPGTTLIEDDGDGPLAWRSGAITYLLFFHGLYPADLFQLYAHLFGHVPAEHEVPVCFAPCYYEIEKMKLLRLIRRAGPG